MRMTDAIPSKDGICYYKLLNIEIQKLTVKSEHDESIKISKNRNPDSLILTPWQVPLPKLLSKL